MNHNKLTVTVAASDGSRAVASIEEMDGTDLPTVEIDAPATAWTLGGRSSSARRARCFSASDAGLARVGVTSPPRRVRLAVTRDPIRLFARRAAAWLAAAALASPTGTAVADTSEGEGEPTSDEQAAFDEARALHKRATTKYDTADFDGAIELWTQAYERIEGHPRANEVRHAMSYNLASAHLEQFEIDGDVQHLGRARVLLERYLTILGPKNDENAAEHARVGQSLERIAALQKGAFSNGGDVPPPVVDPSTTNDAPGARPTKPLIIAGGVTAGVGLGLVAGMAIGLVRGKAAQRDADDPERPAADLDDLEARGMSSNRIAIGTGIAAGVLVTAGAVLLGVGLARRKQRGSSGNAARTAAPVVHLGGLSWRF